MSGGADGYVVIGRNERPLAELHVLRPFRPVVTGNRVCGDGWQVCELGGDAVVSDSVGLLVDVVAATGEPALLGSAAGAGRAAVEGFSGSGGYWRAVLPGEPRAWPEPVEEVAARVVSWAAAARRTVDAAPVVAFLRAPATARVDGMFEELLTLLGLAGTVPAGS